MLLVISPLFGRVGGGRSGLLRSQSLLRRTVLSRTSTLPLGRLERRRDGDGVRKGHWMRLGVGPTRSSVVVVVGAVVVGISGGWREQAAIGGGRGGGGGGGGSGGGGVVVVVVVEVGTELW